MLETENRVYLKMQIGNLQVPAGALVPKRIILHSDAKFLLPNVSMVLSDPTNFLGQSNNPLLDGLQIQMTLGTSSSDANVYKFRLFNPRRAVAEAGLDYKLTGYWDAPLYYFASDTMGYNTTSSSVINTIAGICGLQTNISGTTDTQGWYQANMRYGAFCRELAVHGYISNSSLMVIGVDLTGTLNYLDFNGINFGNAPTLASSPQKGTTIFISQHKVLDNFGLQNAIRGYKLQTVEQKLDGPNNHYTDIQLKVISSTQQLNSSIQGIISRARVEYSALGTGTDHALYYQAYHQNLRGYALNASGLLVLCPSYVTGLDLFSPVNVNLTANYGKQNAATDPEVAYNGAYVVIAKQIIVIAGNYAEKLWLARSGINKT